MVVESIRKITTMPVSQCSFCVSAQLMRDDYTMWCRFIHWQGAYRKWYLLANSKHSGDCIFRCLDIPLMHLTTQDIWYFMQQHNLIKFPLFSRDMGHLFYYTYNYIQLALIRLIKSGVKNGIWIPKGTHKLWCLCWQPSREKNSRLMFTVQPGLVTLAS